MSARKEWRKLWKRLPALHARGLNDRQIAQRLGCGITAVCRRRKRLGLPANARVGQMSAEERVKARRRIYDRLRREGHWALRLRVEAMRRWFGAETPTDARLLDLLEDGTERTARDISRALGWTYWDGCSNSTANMRLRKLIGLGLVEKISGGQHARYRLAAGARRRPWHDPGCPAEGGADDGCDTG